MLLEAISPSPSGADGLESWRSPEAGMDRLLAELRARRTQRRELAVSRSLSGELLASLTISLEDPRSHAEALVDPGPLVDEIVERRLEAEWARALTRGLAATDSRAALVIEHRFGLRGDACSIRETARRMRLAPTTVFDLEERGLEQLREAAGLRERAVGRMRAGWPPAGAPQGPGEERQRARQRSCTPS